MRQAHARLWAGVVMVGLAATVLWQTRQRLRSAHGTPLYYYLALPKGWEPTRSWPVLVSVDGANHGRVVWHFLRVRWARRDLPFILIVPLVVSNGGRPDSHAYPYTPAMWAQVAARGAVPFDAAGVLAVVDEVRRTYHGQATFWITGWSAGGHLVWHLVLTHPERLAGAVLANANYAGRGITAVSQALHRVDLPVHAFQGGRDPRMAALTQQWALAAQQAGAHGYTNLSREIIAGSGHTPFAGRVWRYLAASTRRPSSIPSDVGE